MERGTALALIVVSAMVLGLTAGASLAAWWFGFRP